MTNRLTPTRLGLTLGALLLAMAAGSCSDSPTTPTPTPPPSTAPPAAPPAPTLSQIQTQIFDVSCTGCHTDVGRNPSGGLNLKAGSAHASLVNVASSGSSGAMRVIPGNANTSYLVMKLEGAPGIVGMRMPRNGPPFLTDAQVKMIRDWIAAGAPNN
jgi:mono/diheme cytochrome c family protein